MSMELKLTKKEEVREHNILMTSLIPPQDNKDAISRRPTPRVVTTTAALPSVWIESEETRAKRKRRSTGWRAACRKYGPLVVILVAFLVLMEELDEWFSLEKWDDILPVSIQRDYTNIQSVSDLSTVVVDTWCFPGRPKCTCSDPIVSDGGRAKSKWWMRVHEMNIESATTAANNNVDVLFLGDALTENWHGTSRGHDIARAAGVPALWTKYFHGGKEGRHEGVALGISGDTSPNLLWRIENGELPETLNPKVIWVLIGTHDFGNTWCSAEMVVIGILRVIEELRARKPDARIVVNGLFPRSYHRKGYVMRGRPSILRRQPKLPSLWRDIVAVNDELKQYCANRDMVEYYEANFFFKSTDVPREELRIDSNLMPDRLHPIAAGYQLWAEQIVAKLDMLLPIT